MSNAGTLGRRDFRNAGDEELIGCSTSQVLWTAASGDVTFGHDSTSDYPPPRFITCNVPGTLNCTGWAPGEAMVERVLVAGIPLHFRPMSITAAGSTAEIVLEW
ncbi:hypothetical protein DRO61_02630 [Candidatus Bathyarchaeota archaeon]|nr:MAG: hypothetical protein DRO61_02630 [Candidatus Bathyarchaeota archaeon]